MQNYHNRYVKHKKIQNLLNIYSKMLPKKADFAENIFQFRISRNLRS